MKAVTWHGRRDVRVEDVPDPIIKEPTDAIVRITSTGLCGSGPAPVRDARPVHGRGRHPRPRADGHRRGGRREVADLAGRRPGRRCPSSISLRPLLDVQPGLYSPVRDDPGPRAGHRRALFGYTKLYGEVPGGQAEYLRVPQAQFRPIKVPEGPPDERFCSSPTCCRPPGRRSSTPTSRRRHRRSCSGLGPIGDMATRIASTGLRVIGVDLVPSGWRGPGAAASRRSTCASTTTTGPRPSAS